MSDTETTGAGIRLVRVAQGLTLRQLAAKAGTSPTYISEVERGTKVPTSKWLRAVLEALADNLRGAA